MQLNKLIGKTVRIKPLKGVVGVVMEIVINGMGTMITVRYITDDPMIIIDEFFLSELEVL